MKRTGEMLRKAREARGLSLTEIAMSLKINSKVLTAIEAGDMSKLPAKTFLRGFVQSYAQALKANSDEIMVVFAEEMGTTMPQPTVTPTEGTAETPAVEPKQNAAPQPTKTVPVQTPVMSIPVREKNPGPKASEPLKSLEEPHRVRTLILTGVSIVLLALIFGTKKMIERYQRESEPANVSVAAPLPSTDDVKETKPEVTLPALNLSLATPTNISSKTTTTEAPVTTLPPTTTTEVVKVTTTTLAKVVEKKPEPTTTAASAAAVAAVTTTTTTEVPAAKGKKNLEMIVEALDNVDIEYSSTSGAPQKLHLNTDQVHTIRSRSGLKLTVSNGGAVNLILNGKDLGVPGDLGKPVKLTY